MNLWEDAKFQYVEQNSVECWCDVLAKKPCDAGLFVFYRAVQFVKTLPSYLLFSVFVVQSN